MTEPVRSVVRPLTPWLASCAALAMPSPASAQSLSPGEAEALRAEIAVLKAQVERLERRLSVATAPAPQTATPVAAVSPSTVPPSPPATPSAATPRIDWRSGPRIAGNGWRFEPIGRLQFDAAHVSRPAGVTDRALGFANEVRRIRLGGEGTVPGGFGYKLEVELSDNRVDLVDTFITYDAGRLGLTLGNHNQFQALDELVGDTSGALMERAAFTDAFNFERRLGVSAEYSIGPALVQAGVFSDSASSLDDASDGIAGGDENDSFGVDGRLVFAPRVAGWQLHLGGSLHWRDLNRLAEAPVRYRQRPFVHVTNTRFLDTGDLAGRGERHGGFELAGGRGRFHFAGEAHWLTLDRIDGPDPTFFGGYAEAGYFLTPGDTRPYSDGIFQRSTPSRPVGSGGIGSVLLTVRYDHLDLDDADVRGGRQNGYIGSLIWSPVPYLRFNLNYARLEYRRAAVLSAEGRDYPLDVVGMRVEFDY